MTLHIRLSHLIVVLLVAGAFYALGQSGNSAELGSKTAASTDPRTSIPSGTTAYTISQPGSYLLSGNITVAGGNIITINANDVSLDLGGYALVTSASPAAGTGIFISGAHANITISNGHIRGSGSVSGDSFTGGKFENAVFYDPGSDTAHGGVSVTNVKVQGCHTGIHLTSVMGTNVVSHCVVQHASSEGINADLVDNCALSYCDTAGIVATKAMFCSVNSPNATAPGISANTVSDCDVIVGSGIGINAIHLVRDSYAQSSNLGIAVNGGVATNCLGKGSTGQGIGALVAANCYGVSTSANGLQAYSLATGCSGQSSSSYGLNASYAGLNCVGSSSSGIGLVVAGTGLNCRGASSSSTGLIADLAQNCFGISDSSTGLNYVLTGALCVGQQSNGGSSNSTLGGGQNGSVDLP